MLFNLARIGAKKAGQLSRAIEKLRSGGAVSGFVLLAEHAKTFPEGLFEVVQHLQPLL